MSLAKLDDLYRNLLCPLSFDIKYIYIYNICIYSWIAIPCSAPFRSKEARRQWTSTSRLIKTSWVTWDSLTCSIRYSTWNRGPPFGRHRSALHGCTWFLDILSRFKSKWIQKAYGFQSSCLKKFLFWWKEINYEDVSHKAFWSEANFKVLTILTDSWTPSNQTT